MISNTTKVILGILLAGMVHAADDRPNILFIMSDDHTAQGIGAYGSRLAVLNPTPVIDSLAREGFRFDKVFCNNSICTPSRASILTGQYPQTNRVLKLRDSLPAERQHLAREMRQAGYETAVIGKWHLEDEPAAFAYYAVMHKQGHYFDPYFRVRGEEPWPKSQIKKNGMHSSDAITDLSIEWLTKKRDKSKPFMLLHHFKAPHDMFEYAPRYETYLEDAFIPEPVNFLNPPDGSVGSRGFGQGPGIPNRTWNLAKKLGVDIPAELKGAEYSKALYQHFLKHYLRCVKGVDDNVQRLLDTLEQTGELDNTIIMYTGDQGFYLGEHGLLDKRWMYEESMRMPLIVRMPQSSRMGQVNDWLINNTDFAPTILDLAGVSTPDYMQGRSFAGALMGEPKPADWRNVTYYRYWMHKVFRTPAHFGIRSDRFKLIFFYGAGTDASEIDPSLVAWEFYDLEKDPHEMNNLYDNPEYQEVIRDMKRQLKSTRLELNETDINYPHIQEITSGHWD